MRADLIKLIIEKAYEGNKEEMKKYVIEMAEEEKRKGRHIFADQLLEAVGEKAVKVKIRV